MTAGRRRRWFPLVLAAAVVFWLLGRGLGILPGGGTAPGPGLPPAPPATAPQPPEATPVPAPAASSAQPGPPPVGEAAPGVEPAAHAAAAAQLDHWQSRLSVVRAAAARGAFVEGCDAAAELAAAALPAPLAQEREAAIAALRQALRTALQPLLADLQRGAVPQAARALQALQASSSPQLERELQAALPPTVAAALRSDVPHGLVPSPQPLAAGRVVQAQWLGSDLQARIVDARPDEVTLRWVQGQGATFPSLPVTAVAPLQPTQDEAVELALAAIAAGDGRLARLWLAFATAAGETPAGSRLATVRKLLQ